MHAGRDGWTVHLFSCSTQMIGLIQLRIIFATDISLGCHLIHDYAIDMLGRSKYRRGYKCENSDVEDVVHSAWLWTKHWWSVRTKHESLRQIAHKQYEPTGAFNMHAESQVQFTHLSVKHYSWWNVRWITERQVAHPISLLFMNRNGWNLVSRHIFWRCLDMQNFSSLSLVLSKLWNF